jgi:hypothetical protein
MDRRPSSALRQCPAITAAWRVLLAYVTGDEVERLHIAAGYAIAGLVALRVVWGSSALVTRGSVASFGRRVQPLPICATWSCSGRPAISAIIRPAVP